MPSNWNQIQLAILTKAFVSIKKMWKSLSAFKSQSVYFIRWTECFAADWNFRFYEEFKDLRKSQNGIYNDSRAVHKTNSDKIIISDILCQHNCQESTRKLQNWNIRQWIDDISQSKQIPQIAEIEFLNFYRLHCFLALIKSICKSFFWLRRNVCFEFVWRYLWLNMIGNRRLRWSREENKFVNRWTERDATGCLTLQVHPMAFMPSIRFSDDLESDFSLALAKLPSISSRFDSNNCLQRKL